ncbi:uncharacterized protein YdgA (DUF945 family) [Plasticicumulans lactativorans]|uniref:Uncharacterized protein YdgA (DUF945 family) n=1 Tax=Plasticicumulans lactativorans TaxID=1133106 RepID=A0A4R2L8J0_9GAMM|nr:DUF945 family protein [Plasticicumulans lactativorans]TCO81626.1 uncharacterized protein YdgA (DUF945 family) [Plasticicumulans lactativorans]
MKGVVWTVVGAAAVAGAVVVGGVYWSGVKTEEQYRAWLDAVNREGIYKASNTRYDRTLFHSEAVTRLELSPPPGTDGTPVVLFAEHAVQHGPWPRAAWYSGGAQPVYGAMRTRFRLDDAAGQRLVQGAYAGKDVVDVVSTLRLDGSSGHDVAVAGLAWSRADTGESLRFSGLQGHYELTAQGGALKGELHGEELAGTFVARQEVEVPADTDDETDGQTDEDVAGAPPSPAEPEVRHLITEVGLRGLRFSVDATRTRAGVWPGNATFAVDTVAVAQSDSAGTRRVELSRPQLRVELAANGTLLDLREAFSVAGVNLDGRPAGSGEFTVSATRIDLPKLQRVNQALLARTLAAPEPGAQADFVATLRALLAPGPVLAVDGFRLQVEGQPQPFTGSARLALRDPEGEIGHPVQLAMQMFDSGSLHLDLPALQVGDLAAETGNAFRLAGFKVDLDVAPGAATARGELRTDELTVLSDGAAGRERVALRGFGVRADQVKGRHGLFTGTTDLRLDSLRVAQAAGSDVELAGFTVGARASEDGDFYDVVETFALQALRSADQPLGSGGFTLALEHLHGPTLGELVRSVDELNWKHYAQLLDDPQGDPEAISAEMGQRLLAGLQQLLTHAPRVRLDDLQVRMNGEAQPLTAQLRLAFGALGPAGWDDPELLQRVLEQGQGTLSVPEAFLRLALAEQVQAEMALEAETPPPPPKRGQPAPAKPDFDTRLQAALDEQLAPLVQAGYIKRAGGAVSTEFALDRGAVTLNGVALPLQ